MENGPFEDVFPMKKVGIFHCYVSLPEGKGSKKDIEQIVPRIIQISSPRSSGSVLGKMVVVAPLRPAPLNK